MRKKWLLIILGLFLIYALAIYVYLFHGANTAIPESMRGTNADPSTFMNKELLEELNEFLEMLKSDSEFVKEKQLLPEELIMNL